MSLKAPAWGPLMSERMCKEAGVSAPKPWVWSPSGETGEVRGSPRPSWIFDIPISTCPNQKRLPSPIKPTLPTSFLVSIPGKFTLLVVHVTKLGSIFLFLTSPSCGNSVGSTFRGMQSWTTSIPQGSRGLCHCPLLIGHHLPPPCPLESLLREWPLLRSLRSHQVSAHRSRLPFPWEEG